ncbi:hypothetical protein D9613_004601 [Agrocybe pediades]|uniref:Uncharacterized protein n=1 Tax=Agrocybe pediades TaxID=84607 RepID=A0A8H4VKL5_9AGAR|nr:hypothetical protein D9613_004601 [Agrocybe pediades]
MDQLVDHTRQITLAEGRELRSRVPTRSGFFGNAHDLDVNGGSFMSAAGNINIYNGNHNSPAETDNPDQLATPSLSVRSSVIYHRNLITKRRGSPLWIPEPDSASPAPYQQKGVSFGDVGLLSPSGSFDFFFNICYPSDDPINSAGVPEGFQPFKKSSLRIRRVQEYDAASYVASESIEISRKQYNDSPAADLVFESSAAEGAILTMPRGARSEDVVGTYPLRGYVQEHIESWYKFIMSDWGCNVQNGDILLVTGCDKTDSWGVATFVKSSEAVRLTFQPIHSAGQSYKWEYSGSFDARTGPCANLIDADLGGGVVSHQPLLNQCVFVRTLTGTLRDDIWKTLKQSVCFRWGLDPDEEMLHEEESFMKGEGHGTVCPTGNSRDDTNAMRGGGSGQQRHHLPALDPSVSVISNVSTAMMDHPSKLLNYFLWTNSGDMYPSARVVITEDKDWISVLRDDDLSLPNSEELYRRITERPDDCKKDYYDLYSLPLRTTPAIRVSFHELRILFIRIIVEHGNDAFSDHDAYYHVMTNWSHSPGSPNQSKPLPRPTSSGTLQNIHLGHSPAELHILSNPYLPSFIGYVEIIVDARRLIHATCQGVIPFTTRRLNESERRSIIKSNAVFIFSAEEKKIERWTDMRKLSNFPAIYAYSHSTQDGLLWSPSRLALTGQYSPERLILGSKGHGESYQGTFKPGGIIKKAIRTIGPSNVQDMKVLICIVTIIIEGYIMHLISSYTSDNMGSGRLKRLSTRSEIMSLYMPPCIFYLTHFRVPHKMETCPHGSYVYLRPAARPLKIGRPA